MVYTIECKYDISALNCQVLNRIPNILPFLNNSELTTHPVYGMLCRDLIGIYQKLIDYIPSLFYELSSAACAMRQPFEPIYYA